MIANKARGEAILTIDGAPRRLCLTLGALARLEAAFDADGLDALAVRLGRIAAGDLIIVLAALLDDTPEALAAAQIDVKAAARDIGEAFSRALA